MAIFDYAPAPETTKAAIRQEYGLFINGQWSKPAGEAFFETINPATEEPIARVAYAAEADVDRQPPDVRTADRLPPPPKAAARHAEADDRSGRSAERA